MAHIIVSLWNKIHGMGMTNPKEAGPLLCDLDTRLKKMEARIEELANDRSKSAKAARRDIPAKPKGDDG